MLTRRRFIQILAAAGYIPANGFGNLLESGPEPFPVIRDSMPSMGHAQGGIFRARLPSEAKPGDMIIAMIKGDAEGEISVPPGWSTIIDAPDYDGLAAWRMVDGSEGQEVAFGMPAETGRVACQTVAVAGVETVELPEIITGSNNE